MRRAQLVEEVGDGSEGQADLIRGVAVAQRGGAHKGWIAALRSPYAEGVKVDGHRVRDAELVGARVPPANRRATLVHLACRRTGASEGSWEGGSGRKAIYVPRKRQGSKAMW